MAFGGSNMNQKLGSGGGNDIESTDDIAEGPPISEPPPPGVIRLWNDVASGIDRSQTVVWKSAVDSLDHASRHLYSSNEARRFVENHMKPVISILLDQQPSKIGQMEKNCVEESLRRAVTIVALDLDAKKGPDTNTMIECTVLETLSMIFNRKKTFYKGSKPNWNVTLNGAPEVRMQMIRKFWAIGGFAALATYLENRAEANPEQFPNSDVLHSLLNSIADAVPTNSNVVDAGSKPGKNGSVEDTVIRICQAVMMFIDRTSEESMKKQANDTLSRIRYDLQVIFDKLASMRRKETFAFYKFWRRLTLKLITSQSLPLRLFGWEQVGELIDASVEMRPPPKYFIVEEAGRHFVNGKYIYNGQMDEDGYARLGGEISYVLSVPKTAPEKDGGGKTMTLFRCTMRSQQKWWFLSEADEDQPGTDKDEDYYQHKSMVHEESEPPPSGWVTCQNAGLDPPPVLRKSGLMVPSGEEFNTLEHQLAKWAIDNGIIELVLGDSVHREVVARSLPLIKFLASMCERDVAVDNESMGEDPTARLAQNAFCLQASHLLLAWKTCTSKADAAVSAEVYHLLVSILPSLPDDLAIPLLSAIQKSLRDGAENDKHDLLPEVAEFCSTLANASPAEVDNNGANSNVPVLPLISDAVRTQVLKLLWAVLTHPDALSLKPYERLKSYVTHELRVEPYGKRHRETFLESCRESLEANAEVKEPSGMSGDESFALRMVKLTRFVLESCPRDHSVTLVTQDDAALPRLLFQELSTYLMRRDGLFSPPTLRKANSFGEANNVAALSERFSIIRYAYGLSDQADMSSSQLDHLWSLCASPADRESMMEFLANASYTNIPNNIVTAGGVHVDDNGNSIQQQSYPSAYGSPLKAAFSDEVSVYAFQHLCCANNVEWELLGEKAYRSFQILFNNQRRENWMSPSSGGPDIDALWKICLTAGNSDVASQAMKDLLDVYTASPPQISNTWENSSRTNALVGSSSSHQNSSWNADSHDAVDASNDKKMDMTSTPDQNELTSNEESFVKRIFQCLVKVRKGLEAGESTSERSAERCLRILNSAVGHGNTGNATTASSAMVLSLPSITSVTTASEALRSVPHGMRGQASYRTISVVARRISQHNHVAPTPSTSPSTSSVRDEAGNVTALHVKLPSVVRFSLNVHPLETLFCVKTKVGKYCKHQVARIKPNLVNGRQTNLGGKNSGGILSDTANISVVPDDFTVAQLGITEGCEIVFLLVGQPLPASSTPGKKIASKKGPCLDLARIFAADDVSDDHLFDTLLAVLEALPVEEASNFDVDKKQMANTSKLVWDLLLAMPTNPAIIDRVRSLATRRQNGKLSIDSNDDDAMIVDDHVLRKDDEWSACLDGSCFHRSIYTLQVVDSLLQPAPEILCKLTSDRKPTFEAEMATDASSFRKGFIDTGGFEAVLLLFTEGRNHEGRKRRRTRMGDAVALRVLKCCFFGSSAADDGLTVDDSGKALLKSLSDPQSLLSSLTEVVVSDCGVLDSAILDVLHLLRLLLLSDPQMTNLFTSLPNNMAERFVTTLLLRDFGGIMASVVSSSARVRRSTQDLILESPSLSHCALPWLIAALKDVDVTSEVTDEFFAVLRKLVEGGADIDNLNTDSISSTPDSDQLKKLGTATCEKLAAHPRPTSESAAIDFCTGVLCGCLKLLRALIENGGGSVLNDGSSLLLKAVGSHPWSKLKKETEKGGAIFDMIAYPWRGSTVMKDNNVALIDLMGAVFDGFLSSAESSSSSALCCDKESRQLGFHVIAAAARSCEGGDGYLSLVTRLNGIIAATAPSLRHRWGLSASVDDSTLRPLNSAAKYSGLRNQGCTCYMNSLLQQLFMMPALRENLCSAPIPSCLRSSGGSKGADLVDKKISLQWDSGVSYEAVVEGFNSVTGMHTIRYLPLSLAAIGGQQGSAVNIGHHHSHHHQQHFRPEDIAFLPEELPEEFFLTEGRPGKETGVFDILLNELGEIDDEDGTAGESSKETRSILAPCGIEETEEEASSRRLLEEVQRTFVHLEEGARGRCFDPRSLVEASGCLKLEFDVWQQNDASEYAMKLLDRLEVSLKRWAPDHFKYLANTFGLKQTKQKYCKECGLKTNREENLMNIDCQIRGKSDIHEALSTMCEAEYMEGDNQVFCDRCKKKCDTILRTAISTLPDVLVLSLKRFDLDYTTFETVKLNSRCAFGQTLNMKKYTLEGVEAMEKTSKNDNITNKDSPTGLDADTSMDMDLLDDPLGNLPDEDYEYILSGVLVHAGVAQGGHYYSYIKDRSPSNGEDADKWYRFDDEDVTPFDPSAIEVECFGGKVKKETKWPSGTVHTVESEQFANALMLFYEKVKPTTSLDVGEVNQDGKDCPMEEDDSVKDFDGTVASGYDIFQPDVRRSNTTHSWHTFLFDAEFQSFLKGLLGLCLISSPTDNGHDGMRISSPSTSSPDGVKSWQLAVLQMSLSFMFDILLHSSDRDAFCDWVDKLTTALNHDLAAAKWFVQELARRTEEVSGNWLRVFCTDCPVQSSRTAAMATISSAIQTCLSCPLEQSSLQKWTEAWNSQSETFQRPMTGKRENVCAMPTKLEKAWACLEDVNDFENGSASPIGVIISMLTTFMELAPRCWRNSADIFVLLRDIGSGDELIRNALRAAQILARLICLGLRERSPPLLRALFPGVSVSIDLAEALTRGDTSSSHMVLPAGTVGMGSGGVTSNNSAIPNTVDHVNLFEALGCIIGVEGVKRASLTEESVGSRGRIISLSPATREALTIIFHESKSQAAGGMGQHEIHSYMNRCGIDMKYVPTQKIHAILTKYPNMSGRDGNKDSRYLSLDGFLAYYRDTAQNKEPQLLSDLHTFGFRLDLTRRPEEFRSGVLSSGPRRAEPLESVALDVAANAKDKETTQLGFFADLGLDSFHLHSLSFNTCEPLAAYVLAASAYNKNSTRLLQDALKALSQAPTGGAGRDTFDSCVKIFKVLLALPDEKQQERINTVMQSSEKALPHADAGVGLLVAAKELSLSRASQNYSADFHYSAAVDRYIDVVKALFALQEVTKWMQEHRSLWLWMEQWGQQRRPDNTGRREGAVHPPPHHHPSDSDMNPGMGNDSEDDEDDYRYDHVDTFNTSGRVDVQDAGVVAVNGTYLHSGTVDGVGKYTKEGRWDGSQEIFSLYRCQLNDRTRKWFISIVPRNCIPGTTKDIDFYWASASDNQAVLKNETPPEKGWSVAKEYGQSPAPICVHMADNLDEDEDVGEGGGHIWNDEDDGIDDDGGRESGIL